MKLIKKYWTWILGIIGTVIGILFLTKKYNDRKLTKTAKQIDDNNQKIDKLDGKIDVIQDQRKDAVENVNQIKDDIKELEEQKDNINPEPEIKDLSVSEVKQDILNKTKRRGRKPKK